jgi:hypothetical protein
MSLAYGQFRAALILRIFDEHLTPNGVADALEKEGLSQVCSGEIGRYRDWGDHWGRRREQAPPPPLQLTDPTMDFEPRRPLRPQLMEA